MIDAYALFDKKVGSYLRPNFVASVVEIHRSMEQLVKDKNSSLCLYPADFAIYKVGAFDEKSGQFIPNGNPEFINEVVDYVSKQPNKEAKNGN